MDIKLSQINLTTTTDLFLETERERYRSILFDYERLATEHLLVDNAISEQEKMEAVLALLIDSDLYKAIAGKLNLCFYKLKQWNIFDRNDDNTPRWETYAKALACFTEYVGILFQSKRLNDAGLTKFLLTYQESLSELCLLVDEVMPALDMYIRELTKARIVYYNHGFTDDDGYSHKLVKLYAACRVWNTDEEFYKFIDAFHDMVFGIYFLLIEGKYQMLTALDTYGTAQLFSQFVLDVENNSTLIQNMSQAVTETVLEDTTFGVQYAIQRMVLETIEHYVVSFRDEFLDLFTLVADDTARTKFRIRFETGKLFRGEF